MGFPSDVLRAQSEDLALMLSGSLVQVSFADIKSLATISQR